MDGGNISFSRDRWVEAIRDNRRHTAKTETK
jgi:hypothetical protein